MMPATYIFVITIIAIVAATIIILASMFREPSSRKKKRRKQEDENPEDVHELMERCKKLSARIESLETIIIKNERNSKSKPND